MRPDFRIIRYLRTPIVDVVADPAGEAVSTKALRVMEEHLPWFKPGSIRTLCLAEWDTKESIPLVWGLLADGGHLILPTFDPEMRKELRKGHCFQVIKESPCAVIRKLSGKQGEIAREHKADSRPRVCIVRYGGLGDHLMATPIVQHFHDEGWHVTYNCTERGADVYKGDPRIDDLMLQEHGIIPADERLRAYWDDLSAGFDKFINLSEVVEGPLLRVEGRPEYHDPQIKRHADCSRNYIDAHFDRAGIEGKEGALPDIWLSEKERDWALKEYRAACKKAGVSFLVLWNLMGSSFHKMYPWMYDVWTLCGHNRDDIGFLTVSDTLGSVLEESRYPKVICRAGKYTIRQTMAMHSVVDAVVTPETNSLITGLAFPAPIIALLSHSDAKQYPWRPQDVPLAPKVKDCPCYPCHQLHYSRMGCQRGTLESSATLCMDSIPPVDVYEALVKARAGRERIAG